MHREEDEEDTAAEDQDMVTALLSSSLNPTAATRVGTALLRQCPHTAATADNLSNHLTVASLKPPVDIAHLPNKVAMADTSLKLHKATARLPLKPATEGTAELLLLNKAGTAVMVDPLPLLQVDMVDMGDREDSRGGIERGARSRRLES